jgi:hypothetical protein
MSTSEFPGGAGKTVITVLLAAILVTQWTVHVLEAREASRTRRVIESIQTLLQKDDQSNTEILGALDDIQDVLDDVHGHLAPERK